MHLIWWAWRGLCRAFQRNVRPRATNIISGSHPNFVLKIEAPKIWGPGHLPFFPLLSDWPCIYVKIIYLNEKCKYLCITKIDIKFIILFVMSLENTFSYFDFVCTQMYVNSTKSSCPYFLLQKCFWAFVAIPSTTDIFPILFSISLSAANLSLTFIRNYCCS